MMESSGKKSFTVNVEGNIGSGKSELLSYFKKFEDILVLEEDVEKWTNFHGYNLLELKLKNPDYYQFPFQSYALKTKLTQHLRKSDKPIKLMERSILTAKRCFVETLKEMGKLHEGAYYVLQEWYDYIAEYHKLDCDLIIYIQVEPEIAFRRINSRSRQEENEITLEYVKAIHQKHEKVFVDQVSKLPAKVLIIDGNLSKEEIVKEYKKCEDLIFAK